MCKNHSFYKMRIRFAPFALFWPSRGWVCPYPLRLLHDHRGNHTVAPVPVTLLGMIWNMHRKNDHDDVIKWKHFPRYWPFVRGILGEFPSRGALMLSVVCAWTNSWSNNEDTGDLRRHRSHHDVTVMWFQQNKSQQTLQCCHMSVLNQQKFGYLVKSAFVISTKKTSNIRITVFCQGRWWIQPRNAINADSVAMSFGSALRSNHYNDVTWMSYNLKSSVIRLFV